MKTETIKEIGKRMGQQKGKTNSYYSSKKDGKQGGLLKKLIFNLEKKEK